MVKFGIIGCGTIGKLFSEAIRTSQGAELVAVCDANIERAKKFALERSDKRKIEYYGDVDSMLRSDIDAVYIGTPSGLHADSAVRAANAHKNIVIEKPIGITLSQLDAIENACILNSVKLCAVSQLSFSDGYMRLKQAVDSSEIGKVFLADLKMKFYRSEDYYLSGGWRGTWEFDGGGALMNQGIHGIGLLLGLMGRPKSVRAITKTFVHHIEVEDTSAAIVEFESGAIANIVATTSVQPALPRTLSLHTERGTVTLTEDRLTQWNIDGREEPLREVAPTYSTASVPDNFSCELHRRQLDDFVAAVNEDREPMLSINEGRAPVELILAIYRSSKSGQTIYFD